MRVLGIESSCDETGIAVYCSDKGLLSQALFSQIAMHQQYGGVVPELASRDHIKRLIPLLNTVLESAQITLQDLDAIAYTAGPGLIGALLTGACFAKALAFSLNIPSLAVHHLEAHLLAAKLAMPSLEFPFIALLVSGGHTQLLEAKSLGHYQILGDTLDDAVGEAFDKTAKTLGLPYPGGAHLAKLASESTETIFPPFPRPMLDRPGLDFSFSGLKTHALQAWKKSKQDHAAKVGIAQAFQAAVVDTLVQKCQRAVQASAIKKLVVAGGVSANQALRAQLLATMQELEVEVYFPAMEYCTDNGAMIAYTGWLHFINGQQDNSLAIDVRARWPFTD
ncbi:MAG: tRNA (adenosine(37)-N6)-threonylcarbamoyltransferase complex transferase subunit TsaD [Gammaproteobacteria bacterium]